MINVDDRVSKKVQLYLKIALVSFLTLLFLMGTKVMAGNREYSVSKRSDGGFTLKIYIKKRHWKPITAEGFFPKEEKSYLIEIIGEGKDWSYRAHDGYFYSLDKIKSVKKHWDIGYAWVDINRKYLYLNLYWVDSPDGLRPSDVSGKYVIEDR